MNFRKVLPYLVLIICGGALFIQGYKIDPELTEISTSLLGLMWVYYDLVLE